MDKVIIFNVGWAMASFCEIGGKRIIIDIWSSNDFSPTLNFLLPYAQQQKWDLLESDVWENGKKNYDWEKYHIDQLIISHPHRDHLSDIENFYKYFYPKLVTTPNDNEGMWDECLDWELVFWGREKDDKVIFFKDQLISGRQPPLQSSTDRLELYYIKPPVVEEKLLSSDYVNNVSLVCLINVSWKSVLFPWDIMKSWSDWMLNNDIINVIPWSKTEMNFKNRVKKTNIFIAPHHGLKSAYNVNIMNEIKDSLELIIIPEKPTTEDDVRQVDNRYYDGTYWRWFNVYDLDSKSTKLQSTIKTSTWHICIGNGRVMKTKNNNWLPHLFSSI